MNLIRALAMPFQLTSLIFVGLSATLLTLMVSIGGAIQVFAILAIYILLSWLNKYAFALLDQIANGVTETPVASVEMLGPFGDPRSWVHPLLGVGLWALVKMVPTVPVMPVIVGAALVFPASLAALATSHSPLNAMNPLMWWRMLRGLGWHYLVLLAAGAAAIGAAYVARELPLWRLLSFAVLELIALCLYSLFGAVIHARRLELGFEPRISPERAQEKIDAERLQRRQKMIEAVYIPIRVADFTRASVPLKQWFSEVERKHIAGDVDAVIAQASMWPERRGLATVARTLIGHLIESKQSLLALKVAEATMKHLPDMALGTEQEMLTLAQLAQQTGRRKLALSLLDSLQRAAPDKKPSYAVQSLRRELTNTLG
jgi:hypothetical protein